MPVDTNDKISIVKYLIVAVNFRGNIGVAFDYTYVLCVNTKGSKTSKCYDWGLSHLNMKAKTVIATLLSYKPRIEIQLL